MHLEARSQVSCCAVRTTDAFDATEGNYARAENLFSHDDRYAELHGIIFNCKRAVCMTFKAKTAKNTVTPWPWARSNLYRGDYVK